jgi:protein-tyrosine phosphatase
MSMTHAHDGDHIKAKAWAAEVIPGMLWLGSGTHAENLAEIQSRNITRILNVADDVPNFHSNCGVIYENLHVADFGQDRGISRVFSQAFSFLESAREQNQSVLVHCAAGANRSATIVIAWLMHSQSMSLLEAWASVKSVKKGVCPMNDNRKQLLAYEREIYGKSSFPTDEAFITLR